MPRRLGPKRANKIRKLFNLGKDDDVTKYAITRKFENKKGKTVTKKPKIQRLVTPLTLQVRACSTRVCMCEYLPASRARGGGSAEGGGPIVLPWGVVG